jgi:hypothetical protein
MRIRIEATDLPGRGGADGEVSVGVQCRQDVVSRVAGDAPVAVWELEATSRRAPDGSIDLTGPYVHGRRGDRFLYLSWGRRTGDDITMFRRAKLMLTAVPRDVLEAADRPGMALLARLGLTAPDGTPRCAAVRPPDVSWSASDG